MKAVLEALANKVIADAFWKLNQFLPTGVSIVSVSVGLNAHRAKSVLFRAEVNDSCPVRLKMLFSCLGSPADQLTYEIVSEFVPKLQNLIIQQVFCSNHLASGAFNINVEAFVVDEERFSAEVDDYCKKLFDQQFSDSVEGVLALQGLEHAKKSTET